MSSINLRLPESLHEQARKLAKKEKVSVNQLITLAVAEKVSALMTEDYLEERAKSGNRNDFEQAMSKVAKIKPKKFDRLP